MKSHQFGLPSHTMGRMAMEAVCRAGRVTQDDLSGPRRYPEVVAARMAAFWLLRHRAKLSYSECMAAMGRRGTDHSTAVSAVARMMRAGRESPAWRIVRDAEEELDRMVGQMRQEERE